MDSGDIIEALNDIFKEVFEDDTLSISIEDSSDTIEGWDSLAQILLLSQIEDRFDVRIPMSSARDAKKVSLIIQLIQDLTSNTN